MKIEAIGKRRVLFVMAAKAEYGAQLGAKIAPLFTGIGPVEAAISLTRTLCDLQRLGDMPDLIVSLGSAGSRILRQGSIYQVSSVSWRDMDASALGFEKGCTPFLDLPAEIALPCHLHAVPKARLSTGGNVVSGAAYDMIDADMVDMETWALLRVAQSFGVELIGYRGISDGKAELTGLQDWTALLPVLDERLAGVIDSLRAKLDAALV